VRNLIVLAAVYATLPIILFRPFFGLLVYSWLAYLRPQDMTFGSSRWLPLAQWVAIAMILGLVLAVLMGRERLAAVKLQTVSLMLLGAWIGFTVTTAIRPELSQTLWGHYWKAMLVALITTGMVRTRERFHLLMLVIAMSIGFLGAKHGLFGLFRGGTRFNHGPGGMMDDNNTFALGLNMALPLLLGIALVERRRLVRWAAFAMAALSMLTILFTFSRGGLLTLGIVGALLIWRSRRRALALAVLGLGLVGFLLASSEGLRDEYVRRAGTIAEYETDNSAMGRIEAWKTSWQVFLDHPVTGVGPNNLRTVFRRYAPKLDRFRVAHNAYFQLLAECGLPALLLFLLVLGGALWRMERLRVRAAPGSWGEVYARMLQVSIVAYMAGSMFLNMAYFELIYHLVGASASLEIAVAAEARTGEAPAMAADDLPWWKRPLPATTRAA
jgi:probable O-glycosylation ligase (exosortase A-associated)